MPLPPFTVLPMRKSYLLPLLVLSLFPGFSDAANYYYANVCVHSHLTEDTGYSGETAACKTGNSSTGTGDCRYTARSVTSSDKFIYACPKGANWATYDTDQDGILNGSDAEPYTYEEEADSDGDGVADSQDVCPDDPLDHCPDNHPGETGNNAYYAGYCASQDYGDDWEAAYVDTVALCRTGSTLHSNDNCLYTYKVTNDTENRTHYYACGHNSNWLIHDVDQDSMNNSTDPEPYVYDSGEANADDDGDGVPNIDDPCPLDPLDECSGNDDDQDGLDNDVDPCPNDPTNSCPAVLDSDGDGVIDSQDICPNDPLDQCDPDENPDGDPGTVGECSDYEPSSATMETVLTAIGEDLKQSPLMATVDSLYSIAGTTGTCIPWVIPFFDFQITLDFHCESFFQSVLYAVSIILALGATWIAIKWAFL